MSDHRRQYYDPRAPQQPIIVERRPERVYNVFRPSGRQRVVIRETTVRRRRPERIERSPSPRYIITPPPVPQAPPAVHRDPPLIRTRSHGMSPRMPDQGFVPLPDRLPVQEHSPRGNGRGQVRFDDDPEPIIHTISPDDLPPRGTRYPRAGERIERVVNPPQRQRSRSQSGDYEIHVNETVRSRHRETITELEQDLESMAAELREKENEIQNLKYQLNQRQDDSARVEELTRRLELCEREHIVNAREQAAEERLRNTQPARVRQGPPAIVRGRARPIVTQNYAPETPRTLPESAPPAPRVIERDPGTDAIRNAQAQFQQRRGTGRGNQEQNRR